MRRLSVIVGLAALLAALGCGGHNSGSTAGATSLSAGPNGLGGAPPPPPPPPR
jgi:hypothetical protein